MSDFASPRPEKLAKLTGFGLPMRLAAILLLFKEQVFIEACVRAIYPVVDSICCTSRHDRNFAGDPIEPDESIRTLLQVPDPDNKVKLVVQRDLSHVAGENTEARLRNAAMMIDPEADYYLIVDSDEIWPADVLQKCWDHIRQTRWAAYRVSSYTYFRKWNYRVVEPGEGYRPLVFLRRGFFFEKDRQIDWRGPGRKWEYLRTGRKPKTVFMNPEWRMHHGSCVGDDARILTKINNYGHRNDVDPGWFERVWKNANPGLTNFHYFTHGPQLFERIEAFKTEELPQEISRATWPEGWIDRSCGGQ